MGSPAQKLFLALMFLIRLLIPISMVYFIQNLFLIPSLKGPDQSLGGGGVSNCPNKIKILCRFTEIVNFNKKHENSKRQKS